MGVASWAVAPARSCKYCTGEEGQQWLERPSLKENGAWIWRRGADRLSRTSKEERIQNTHEQH